MSTAMGTAAQRCANCDIAFGWPAVRGPTGQSFCCAGCAAGGPCTCAYDEVWERMASATRPADRSPAGAHVRQGGGP